MKAKNQENKILQLTKVCIISLFYEGTEKYALKHDQLSQYHFKHL